MEKFGYVRVSSKDQNEDRQIFKMEQKGVLPRRIYVDKASGKNFERPQYKQMMSYIREGDLIYIDALDRLGRDYDEVISEWKRITREINADIVILENETLFDSRKFKEMGDIGRLMEDQFLSLLSYVADQERKKIRARQAEGIEAAKRKGKHLGRPAISFSNLNKQQKLTFEELYPVWKSRNITAVDFMARLDMKKSTFYKIIKEYESNF